MHQYYFQEVRKKNSFFREVQDGAFEQTLSLATLSVIETHGHLPFDGTYDDVTN